MAHQDDLRRSDSMLDNRRDQPTIAPPASAEMADELQRKSDAIHAMGIQLLARSDELRNVAKRLRGDQ
jgi:hypothetical protein